MHSSWEKYHSIPKLSCNSIPVPKRNFQRKDSLHNSILQVFLGKPGPQWTSPRWKRQVVGLDTENFIRKTHMPRLNTVRATNGCCQTAWSREFPGCIMIYLDGWPISSRWMQPGNRTLEIATLDQSTGINGKKTEDLTNTWIPDHCKDGNPKQIHSIEGILYPTTVYQ